MNHNTLVVGATSGIARALCQMMASRGCTLVLAARNDDELDCIARDIRIRHVSHVFTESFEATDFESHAAFFDRCLRHVNGDLEGIILCHGYFPDQKKSETEFEEACKTVEVNFLSAMSLLHLSACYLEKRKAGYIAAISSVAGDRGRQSNYTYGASKAALNCFLQGLRNRLWHVGVHVLTIKPGFVDTRMTHGLLNPNSPLVATPEDVAKDIDTAIQRRKNVIYSRWFWRSILTAICLIPEWAFKRLRM
jgi:short-subunit dehydrogenase